ncbi:MAG: 3-dehydroquinate synthase [Thermovirga sp.]|nr:3-dehydroquinate synthase [Thermovirga sp.]
MKRPSIFIGGFMAAGKTTVGRALSVRTGMPFVDLDALIEWREGMTVAEIFKERGESYFRDLERRTLFELLDVGNIIVSLGGGTLLNGDLRNKILEEGTLVILGVSPGEAIARARKEPGKRPLLDEKKVEVLWEERKKIYEGGNLHIQTDGKTVKEILDEVLLSLGLLTDEDGPKVEKIIGDSIFIGGGILCEEKLKMLLGEGELPFVVADELTGPFFADKLGPLKGLYVLPRGEEAKSLEHVERIYEAFSKAGVDRESTVIALGGGSVGDVVGFAAATWMRGVSFVQCPTTLLAQVDSSIGGKVGVNLPFGKNLVGAFYKPKAVISDVKCLLTLSWESYRQGLGEIVKYGLGEDWELFELLKDNVEALIARRLDFLVDVIARCVAIKQGIVEADEQERKGERMRLNLGHTIGHAIEAASGYKWMHGDAVSVGMIVVTLLSCKLGLCSSDVVEMLKKLLVNLGLPVKADISWSQILPYLEKDKKFFGQNRRLVLPRSRGKSTVVDDIPLKLLRECYEEVLY